MKVGDRTRRALGAFTWAGTVLWLVAVAGCGDATKPDAQETTGDADAVADVETSPDTPPQDTAGDTGSGEVDIVEDVDAAGACEDLRLTGTLEANDVSGVFTLGGGDLGLGSADVADVIVFELYSDAPGVFELGVGDNDNYATCEQCVRILQDSAAGSGQQPRQFFPTAGTIEIEYTRAGGRDVRITLRQVEFVEVTIRSADFRSTPVAGGSCYRSSRDLVLETGACEPQCGTHVCGDDGCGGVCGSGCAEGTTCALDGKRCVSDATECLTIAVTGELTNPEAGIYRVGLTELGLGLAARNDFLLAEFYKNATGGFSLGAGVNRNYRTCEQCLRLFVDGDRIFFQREGLLTVGELSVPIAEPGVDAYVDLQLQGVVLQEVTLDDEFNSAPIPGGACLRLQDGPLRSAAP